ncbi:MAG: hypothetical protein ABII22_04495 [Candidatus Micrarchaeota archaeon]
MQLTLANSLGLDTEVIRNQPKVKGEKWFNSILWAICGPIIVMPGYTDMTIPENIRAKIQIERLLLAAKQERMASEAETMWYISTASFTAPLDRDWAEIFMYLVRKFMLAENKELPDFLREQVILESMQESDLKRIREWLFKTSYFAVKNK